MAKQKMKTQSPIGAFKYAFISGQGTENYEGDGYEYKIAVDVPEELGEDYVNEIEDFIEDHAPKVGERGQNKAGTANAAPYTYHEDDADVPEGYIRFQFKTKTEFEDPKTGELKPTTVHILNKDGIKVKLPENKFIGNGSTGKAIGTLVMWERGNRKKTEYGASLYLDKVQLKDFIPYEGEVVEAIEGGSFNGFDEELEPQDDNTEDTPKRRPRRSHR